MACLGSLHATTRHSKRTVTHLRKIRFFLADFIYPDQTHRKLTNIPYLSDQNSAF